jgi:hypothetical protein
MSSSLQQKIKSLEAALADAEEKRRETDERFSSINNALEERMISLMQQSAQTRQDQQATYRQRKWLLQQDDVNMENLIIVKRFLGLPKKEAPPLATPFWLLQLPHEVRAMIYKCLFTPTRLVHGSRYFNNPYTVRSIRPCPNSLAILRICHQIHQKAPQGVAELTAQAHGPSSQEVLF